MRGLLDFSFFRSSFFLSCTNTRTHCIHFCLSQVFAFYWRTSAEKSKKNENERSNLKRERERESERWCKKCANTSHEGMCVAKRLFASAYMDKLTNFHKPSNALFAIIGWKREALNNKTPNLHLTWYLYISFSSCCVYIPYEAKLSSLHRYSTCNE